MTAVESLDAPPTLAPIPTAADFTSATQVDHYDDMVALPGLTNHVTVVQVDHDVLAVRSLNVPPVSTGDTVTGHLLIGGRLARSYGEPVECTWRPDRVDRATRIGQWEITTTTVVPPGEPGVLVRVRVTNTGADADLALGVAVASAVTHSQDIWTPKIDGPWDSPFSPSAANRLRVADGIWWGTPEDGSAVSAQTLRPVSGAWRIGGTPTRIQADCRVEAGATVELCFALAVASARLVAADPTVEAEAAARASLDRLLADPSATLEASRAYWDANLASMFGDDPTHFTGRLPLLHTSNPSLRTLYWWGALGVLYHRRDNPASVLGRTYDTLMPKHWSTATFIWDYSLSSLVHALADPTVMRTLIAHWVGLDIDRHFGSEWLAGTGHGYWYSVNHYAMTRLVHTYVSYSGDRGLLDEVLAAADGERKSVAEHLVDWSRAWHRLRTDSGLADYGDNNNLLECVPGYTHEVVSLNAANVWCLRTAAEVTSLLGDDEAAATLRAEADDLLALVLARYEPGQGVWRTRIDGHEHLTRHCYDFATVGTTIPADLPPGVGDEMVDFFVRELQTPSWMRALSPWDDSAPDAVRPDHQWNGAYPAWPADSARAAIALGRPEVVAGWLDGLARTTRQGPPGQAHFVEEAAAPVDGGARKTPAQAPYLIDWACSAAGAWCELVVNGIFGVEATLDGRVSARPVLDLIDPHARLEHLQVSGRAYTVDAAGVREEA